jgi:sugar phosphate isomerase/epimerase
MAARLFELASVMETGLVRAFSFYAPEGEDIHALRDDAFGAVSELLSLARPYGITLCHENEANVFGDKPQYCRELLDAFGGELKCVFDMGNYVLEGVDPYPEAYELLKKDIAYFHVKDALAAGAIVPPGRGEAKIREILTAHRAFPFLEANLILEFPISMMTACWTALNPFVPSH